MDRRKFLRHIAQTSVGVPCCMQATVSFSSKFVSNKKLIALPFFLDTLIPADITPSASQLGLQATLIKHAQSIKNYTKLLELGCQWLDLQANSMSRKNFSNLHQEGLEKIVSIAEESRDSSIPKLFFDRVKSDLFSFYYSHPESWTTLGFYSPPQPLGYPNFTLPPEVKS